MPVARGGRHPRRAAAVVVALVLVALGMVSGCAARTGPPAASPAAVAAPQGSSRHTITVDGRQRTFLLYRPADLPAGRPAPLVLMVHGGGGSASQAEGHYGWDAQADRAGFVVAYPDGVGRSWAVGGGCCGAVYRDGIDDVAFLGQVVAAAGQLVPVDPRRVYATGISEGGMMSYRLACATTLLTAIGPDSATLLGTCPAPHPLSVIHVHGTADTRITYDGSTGSGTYHIHGPAVPTLSATWRAVDGCAAPAVSVAGAVTTSLASCAGGRAVELVTVAGAGHQWPGAACNLLCAGGMADPPSPALDATSTIWAFFAAHPAP